MKHKHHIVPKHAGGSDDPSNIVELSIEEHAEAHRKLYEECGRWQDLLAWKGLTGQISNAEARSEVLRQKWTHDNPMFLESVQKMYSDRMKKSNPNKGGASAGRSTPIEVTWSDGTKESFSYAKALTDQLGIPYATVKWAIRNSKGIAKHSIEAIQRT